MLNKIISATNTRIYSFEYVVTKKASIVNSGRLRIRWALSLVHFIDETRNENCKVSICIKGREQKKVDAALRHYIQSLSVKKDSTLVFEVEGGNAVGFASELKAQIESMEGKFK